MFWKSISGVSNPIPIRRFNGIYYPDDIGFDINEEFFEESMNFSSDAYPSASVRKSLEVIKNYGVRIMGLGKYLENQILVILGDARMLSIENGVETELSNSMDTSKDYTFCHFQGNLGTIHVLISNGSLNMWKYDGVTLSSYTDPPDNADYITTHSNRLYCAKENRVYYSALNSATDWTTVDEAGSIGIITTDGEEIIGLNSGISNLTVFKPSTLFELYGKNPRSYSLVQVEAAPGAISNKAITRIDNAIVYVSINGIYMYAGGLLPSKTWTSNVERDTLNNVFPDICAEFVEDCLYVRLEDMILQYDAVWKTWYSWDAKKAVNMLVFQNRLYIGTDDGKLIELNDSEDGELTGYAITKKFTSDSTARKQHWFKLWVVATIYGGSKLDVYIRTNKNTNWTLVKSETNTQTGQIYKEMLVPLNRVTDANYVQLKFETKGKVVLHEITRQMRHMPMRR